MELQRIRNFCIIAHIDHGKSTLADRLLELTGTISARDAVAQLMDQMDLERERGITIKAKAVRMAFKSQDGLDYEFNLIDTPGHVDFTYEVSRSLAACEGAILVVDASQGIQAQTIANVYLALDHNLTVIPFINKIDLPMAEPERVAKELEESLGFSREDMVFGSAKDGTGAHELLEAIVRRVPPPKGDVAAPLRALIFDSKYDSYKGVLAYVRVMDGMVTTNQSLRLMFTGTAVDALEVGVFKPHLAPTGRLEAGEVGYVATGLKNVRECQVGDTITSQQSPSREPLPGYKPLKPMVFAGLYPMEGDDYPNLREALDKLRLNDASLSYDPESSAALGHGFRCGFLGLLHMDIVQERLEREFGLKLLATAPSVAYQVRTTDGSEVEVDNPSMLPEPTQIALVREPWLKVTIITPSRFIGGIMDLVTTRRGEFKRMEYLESRAETVETERRTDPARDARVLLEYNLPLADVLVDFYDQLKSRTQGYASMDYSIAEYREAPLVKVEVLVNGQPLDALSIIVHRANAHQQGKALVERLKDLIPRQLFEVALQAAIGRKIIARETVKAMRKNVLAKCYGGDITRKRKLLEKQAEGKKRLKKIGHVEIPQEAFFAILKLR